jgi:uncharacterized protein
MTQVLVERGVLTPMRDGHELVADVYRPAGRVAPALVQRTPYGRAAGVMEAYAAPSWYARQGFAVVCQDTRGRGDSPGEFVPYRHEAQDGADTIEWVSGQEWCTGAVGMYGFSYPGMVQLLAAGERPRGLGAIAPAMAGSSFHDHWTYQGGALQLGFLLLWLLDVGRVSAARAGDAAALAVLNAMAADPASVLSTTPLREVFPESVRVHLPYFQEWLDRPSDDEYWRSVAPREVHNRIDVPGLHITGWYDVFSQGSFENHAGMSAATTAPQMLVAGPWWHTPWSQYLGTSDFGDAAASPIDELQVAFFRHHLSDPTGEFDEPLTRVFVMGENTWRFGAKWPPSRSQLRLFLRSDGRANSLSGSGRLDSSPPDAGEPADTLPSDPNLPVQSLGGRSCCYPDVAPMGPADQRSQESRNDVLVYTGAVLERGVRVIGEPRLTLTVASESPSLDVVVRLVDVHPDGAAINVADGIQRIALDGEARVEISLSPTAIMFAAGHRIRCDLMASSFPQFDRNPHTGEAGWDSSIEDALFATHMVVHDAPHPAFLELPTVAGDAP